MHFSEHHIKDNLPERNMTLEQAIEVVNNPIRTEVQANGRVRYWGYVEAIGHYIRVVVDTDGETIVTTFPDSRFRP